MRDTGAPAARRASRRNSAVRFEAGLFQWVLIAGGVALLLGVWGFFLSGHDDWNGRTKLHHALIQALQAFFLNASPEAMTNWQTWLASLLAPATTASAIVLAWRTRILRYLGVRSLVRTPPDEVFIGGGDLATAILANRLPAAGGPPLRVAMLDPAANTPLGRLLEDAGPALWSFAAQGDGRSDDDLRKVNAAQARTVWVLAGDDLVNLDIVRELVEAKAARTQPPRPAVAELEVQRILVCMRDATLVRARNEMRPLSAPGVRIDHFSLARITARQLLKEHPPERYPADDPSQPPLHLCVLGDGELSAELLVHAATHCIYSERPDRAVRLTLIGPGARETLERMYRRHPALDPTALVDERLAALMPLATFAALDVDPAQLTPAQWWHAQDDGRAPFANAYVTTDDDTLTFAAVRRVLAVQDVGAARGHLAAPVVACLNDRTAEATELNGRWPPGVALFDIFARCFSRSQPYPAADADARARRVNDAHQGQPWDALSDRFRWSSRLAADHMDVKLALLGLSPHDSDLPRALRARMQSDEAMRWLTRLEHRRFVVERLIEGWLLLDRPSGHPDVAPSRMRYAGQGSEWTQKRFLDLNDTLVPFDELPEETADIDRSIVEAMIECFEAERSTRPSA